MSVTILIARIGPQLGLIPNSDQTHLFIANSDQTQLRLIYLQPRHDMILCV